MTTKKTGDARIKWSRLSNMAINQKTVAALISAKKINHQHHEKNRSHHTIVKV
jgi:hypothetical protein